MPPPRSPLDRTALDRVLSRAAELQGQQSDDSGGALTDEQILDLGKEVGLTPEALRQAIAEERGRVTVPTERGFAGAWFGGATIAAVRVVPGAPATVLATLDELMRGELPFDVLRRFPDRMQWEPRRTFLDAMRMQLARPGVGIHLRLAEDVGATVIGVDGHRTHVRMDATLTETRAGAIRRTVVATGGTGTIGMLGALAGLTLIVPIVIGAVGVATVAAERTRFRRRAFRVATAVEQVLDRLEFGPAEKRGRGLVDKLLR